MSVTKPQGTVPCIRSATLSEEEGEGWMSYGERYGKGGLKGETVKMWGEEVHSC